MSENRFLETFYAVAASAVLVCGTMLFLVATSDWGHPTSDIEASVPTRVDAAQLSTRSEAEPIARLPIDPPSTAPSLASDQADVDFTASTADLPQVVEPGASLQAEMSATESDARAHTDPATRGMPPSPGPADAPSDEVGRDPATEEDAIASNEDEDAAPEVTIAEPSQPASPIAGDTAKAASVERSAIEEAAPPATPEVAEAKAAEPSQTQNLVTSEVSDAANAEQVTTEPVTPPTSPQMEEAKIAEPSPPASPIASDANQAASVEQATPEASMPPASTPVADVKIAEPSQPASPVAGEASKAASVEPATKPVATPPAPQQVAEAAPPPKPVARPSQPQEAPSQPRGKAPWKPMSLAPADKPSISLSKVPTSRPSASGYRATVWSALARHKPKAGQRGSATVIFAIGQNGALRGVRVGRSSGNTRLDQLALATVRNAAPYPAPPGGAQSFTIRIDFH
jgi:periplasmic protein TonB